MMNKVKVMMRALLPECGIRNTIASTKEDLTAEYMETVDPLDRQFDGWSLLIQHLLRTLYI